MSPSNPSLGPATSGCWETTASAVATAPTRRVSSRSWPERSPHLMVSDPPYGVSYDPSWRARRGVSSGKLAQGTVVNDDRADWRQAYALFSGDVAYVWHGALHGDVVGGDLTACGFELRAQIVWAKPHFTLGRGHDHWRHQTCWYAVREGKSGH
jgi:hypothetical protein